MTYIAKVHLSLSFVGINYDKIVGIIDTIYLII